MGPAAPVHETFAEAERGIVNDAGLLEGKKVFISTVGWEETLVMGTFLGFTHGTVSLPRFDAPRRGL
jgi:hypothetical protein